MLEAGCHVTAPMVIREDHEMVSAIPFVPVGMVLPYM